LSQPVSTTHIETGMNRIYADSLGIDAGTPCVIGGSDGCLANLGSNAVMPGDVSLTIGTSGAVRMIVNKPSVDERQHLFNYILDDSLYVSGGPINNGGILLKWYAENFLHRSFEKASDFEWFVNEASQVPAGSEGLVFLPYVQGERAPVWDAEAKGIFFGIHSGHTQTHFMRAIVEGICYSLYQVAESIECCIGEIKRVYASGGFIRSVQWLQILSDVFNKRIDVMNASDASAVGAAILGLKALGVMNNLADAKSFFTISESILPNESNHLLYKKYMAIYNRLYEQSKESFHLLHELQHQ
jgi:gluconokinase